MLDHSIRHRPRLFHDLNDVNDGFMASQLFGDMLGNGKLFMVVQEYIVNNKSPVWRRCHAGRDSASGFLCHSYFASGS
jgi:hypothetical protein